MKSESESESNASNQIKIVRFRWGTRGPDSICFRVGVHWLCSSPRPFVFLPSPCLVSPRMLHDSITTMHHDSFKENTPCPSRPILPTPTRPVLPVHKPYVAFPPEITFTSQSNPSKSPLPLVALVSWMDHCRPRRVCSASASLICEKWGKAKRDVGMVVSVQAPSGRLRKCFPPSPCLWPAPITSAGSTPSPGWR